MQDVVYYFAPQQSGSINVSLCGSAGQTFDTKLYVFQGLAGASPAPVPVACQDDFCGYLSSLTVRPALQLTSNYLQHLHGLRSGVV